MSSRNGTSRKDTEGTSKTVGKRSPTAGCLTQSRSKSKADGAYVARDSRTGSAADKKMMRAWATISENRGTAKRNK